MTYFMDNSYYKRRYKTLDAVNRAAMRCGGADIYELVPEYINGKLKYVDHPVGGIWQDDSGKWIFESEEGISQYVNKNGILGKRC